MPPLECAAPNCTQVIPEERRRRYPNTKTCSPPCAKANRKAYVANWMGFYVLKKADLDTDPRWAEVHAREEAGDLFQAAVLRGKIEMQARKDDEQRRSQSEGNIKTYKAMHPKRPLGG